MCEVIDRHPPPLDSLEIGIICRWDCSGKAGGGRSARNAPLLLDQSVSSFLSFMILLELSHRN